MFISYSRNELCSFHQLNPTTWLHMEEALFYFLEAFEGHKSFDLSCMWSAPLILPLAHFSMKLVGETYFWSTCGKEFPVNLVLAHLVHIWWWDVPLKRPTCVSWRIFLTHMFMQLVDHFTILRTWLRITLEVHIILFYGCIHLGGCTW